MIAPVQRRPMSSMAWWKGAQSAGVCIPPFFMLLTRIAFAAAAATGEVASGVLVALGLFGPVGPAIMLSIMINLSLRRTPETAG